MKDYLIKLSDAIAALGEKPLAWVGTEYELGLQNQWQLDINALKRLPPAQSEPHWIPCSERVPEEDEQVLVYLYDFPYIAWIDSNGEWNTEDFTLDKEEDREGEPIAWMSLPEPYKEEE